MTLKVIDCHCWSWPCCRVAADEGRQCATEAGRAAHVTVWAKAVGVADSWPRCRVWSYCRWSWTDHDSLSCRKLQRSRRSQCLSSVRHDHCLPRRLEPHQSTPWEPVLSANCRRSVWCAANWEQRANIQRQPISNCWICTSCNRAVPSVYQVDITIACEVAPGALS